MSEGFFPKQTGDSSDPPLVTVRLQPEERIVDLPRRSVKNVRRLLETLDIRPCTALVARDGDLLTPDREILPGDHLLVRKVTSSG